MDENKSMSLAVLGVVAVIAVVSVVLLLTNAQTTGLNVGVGDKSYGGAARSPNRYYETQATRIVGDPALSVGTEKAMESGIPFRSYARAQAFNPSLQTSCGPEFETMDFNHAGGVESRYGVKCLKSNGAPDGVYCCPRINRAKGEVID